MKKRNLLFKTLLCLCCTSLFFACDDDNDGTITPPEPNPEVKKLSEEMIKVRDYAPIDAIVGHRGTAFWAPESTEAAYRWARETGVDYLEADLQLTKDGIIVIVHDDNIRSKTDVETKFPDRIAKDKDGNEMRDKDGKPIFYVRDFTLAELRSLDAGSWFNESPDHKKEGRSSFVGAKILTLEDMIMIAQGKKLQYAEDGTITYVVDDQWKGNVPGIYLETKEPRLNPGQDIEKKLYDELDKFGWNIATKPSTDNEFYKGGKVNVGNTNGKVVFQTFSKESLVTLNKQFNSKVPLCLLLWLDPNDPGYAMVEDTKKELAAWINYGVENGAQFVGPSIAEVIAEGEGQVSTYADLLSGWRTEMIHASGMYAHPYTFDKVKTMDKYYEMCEGMFTNIAEETIKFYNQKGKRKGAPLPEDPSSILDRLGYVK